MMSYFTLHIKIIEKINLIFNANLKSNDTQGKSILHIQNLKYQLQTSFFSLCEKLCVVGM
jgi:hypothetical protein